MDVMDKYRKINTLPRISIFYYSPGMSGRNVYTKMTDEKKALEVQGIFSWTGQAWKRLRKIGVRKFTRDRKIFFALNIPDAANFTLPELAKYLAINITLDQGLESEELITDPQKVNGGMMMPQTEQESTDYPGRCVWVGWIDVPRYGRFSSPGIHNITIEAGPRENIGDPRDFSPEKGGVTARFDFEILEDRPMEDRPVQPAM
jgi:hypothetical protein